ncbi:hypothetical protein P0D88_32335 [Paraburkholderia sp. RL18-103-BIB-C]|jgi:hypothetical protein|uniref:hypothetical protein n=1 Tax=Paraburkholderia sp. RL18-103-BIB-C TaxID=3031637 RepID=UPI0038BB8175
MVLGGAWPSPLLAATPYNRIPKAVYTKEYREEAVGALVEQTVLYDLDDATLPGAQALFGNLTHHRDDYNNDYEAPQVR